jgi:hypothetical protein
MCSHSRFHCSGPVFAFAFMLVEMMAVLHVTCEVQLLTQVLLETALPLR